MSTPAVSVVVTTYNHEKYIKQCIESIVNQRRDFDIEIIVGDDCSTDSTADVIKELSQKYAPIIKPILRKKNIGANRNSHELYNMAQADYIAFIEGDDFWTDDRKLSKQKSFLENNPQYGGCSCDFMVVDENGERVSKANEDHVKGSLYIDGIEYTWNDFWAGKMPGQAGTLFFRNCFKIMDDTTILYKAHHTIGDYTIAALVLTMGNICVLKDTMSAYRKINLGGDSWTTRAGNDYVFAQIFEYHRNLERYIYKTFNIRGNQKLSERVFFQFANSRYRDSSKAKSRMLLSMLKSSSNKLRYVYLMFTAKYLTKIERSIVTMNVSDWDDMRNTTFARQTYSDFWNCLNGKELVLYGAGGGCYDFIQKWYDKIQCTIIVDNDKEKIGKYMLGTKIYERNKLLEYDRGNTVIIITPGTYIKEIYDDLSVLGFKSIFSFVYMELNTREKTYFKKIMHEDFLKVLT